MDKRKAIVIAVVLFLLIGLGTFVFANPSEERLDGNDTGITDNGNNNEVDGENTDGEEETEQPAEETEDDDVISVIDDGNDNTGNGNSGNGNSGSSNNNNNNGNGNNNENNNNKNNNNNNGGSTEEDNSAYLAALAALEKAEASYLQGDLDAANDLISDLADGSDKKGLVDRANALQNVIDVETLVKNLQNQVNVAENIDNVNSARDYRANEDIINKVNNLADSSKKEELKGILSEVAVILDDTKAPGISGIDNGVVTALDVALTVDETNVTVLVNGEEKTLDEIKNITEHGTYKVIVTDQAYNATTIEFTIDKKLPEFNVESGTHSENAMEIVVTDDTFDYMNVTNQDTGVTEKYTTSIITLEDEATYHIYAFDKAGNYQELWVAIDKNPPTINVAGTNVDGYFRDEEVTLTVFDKFLTEVTVNGETFDKDDFTYANNNENATLTKTYTAEGKYEVVAKDKFGHVTTYTFVIDQTAPALKGIENGGVYKEAILEIIEENLGTAEIRKENGRWEDFTSGYKVSESGTYSVKIIDKAYNKLEITFTIDADAPEGYNVGILNVTHYRENNSHLDYAKVDDEIRIMVYFKEQLATLPTLVLNGVELENEFFYAEDSSNVANSEYVYMVDVKLTQEVIDQIGLTDGIINFAIKGYADALGNVGAELTNANILENANYPSVEFDSVKPVLNFNNGMITSSFTVEVTEDNFDYMIVKPLGGTEVKVTEKTYEISGNEDNLRYEITVYDKAGNVSDYRSIYLDNQPPVLTATGYNGSDVPVENGKSYQKVTVNITDGSLKKVVLLNEDGSEKEVLKTFDDNYVTEKMVYEETFGDEGTYTIKGVDRNNQEVSITFTIDKTAPKRSAANILEYNADNNLGTYYVKTGDTIHAYVSFDEPLAENPTIVFVNDGKEYAATRVDQLLPDALTGKYIYNAYYEVNETDMIDGEVTFKVTNIKDEAGNTTEVTEVTNGHHVYIDRTLIKENWLYFLSANTANRKVVGNGQNLIVEAVFDEEFTSVPKVKIGKGQYADLSCEWMDEEDGWSSRKFVCRNSIITLDNELAKLENNQIIPIEVTNIVDLAGNETVLTNENIKETAEYGEVTFDGKAPEYVTLRLLKIEPEYGTYAKLGEKIRIIVNFDDVTLAVAPTIRLGNDNNYIIKTMAYDENMKSYTLNYDIIDTELPEGELEIQIYGYADEAGNGGATLTNANINHETQNKVIIDRESPKMDLSKISSTFEVGVDTYVYPQPGVVTDNVDGNISFGEVHMQWFKKNDDGSKGEVTTCFGGDNWNTGLTNCDLGTYIVTYRVSDKAGNESYLEKEIIVQDTTDAVIKPDREDVTNFVQGEDIYTETGTVSDNYDNIDFSDINIDYYLKDNDGNETKQPEFKLGSDLSDIPAGIYRIHYWYSDSAGNESELSKIFNLKNMQAIEKVLDLVDDAKKVMNDSSIDKTLQQHAIDYALQEANKLPNFEEKLLFITELNELQSVMNNNRKYDEILGYYNKINEYLVEKDYTSAQKYIDIVKQQLSNLNNYEVEKENILTGVNNFQTTINNNKKYEEILGYYNKINEYLIAKDYTSAQKYIDIVKQQLPNLQNYETEKQNILTGVNNFQATINNNKKYEEILDYYNKISEYLIVGDYESAQKYIDIVKQQLPNLQNYETEKQNISNKIEEFQKQLNSLKQA